MQIFIYDLFLGAMLYMNYLQKGMDDNEYDWWRGERRMGESEREGKGEDVKCGKEIGFSGDF